MMVELDGSLGEGGGQIVRTSLALALVTGKPFRIVKVRAGRARPGLQPQHRTSVEAAARVSKAAVSGGHLGSQTLVFEPGPVAAGRYFFPIGTAGAAALVLQTVALPLALCGGDASTVEIQGGTHVKASPCFEFLQMTWCGHLRRMGVHIDLTLLAAGFYPRGGGSLQAKIAPAVRVAPLGPAAWGGEREPTIGGCAVVAGLPGTIAGRMAGQARLRLRRAGLDGDITTREVAGGPGAYINLWLGGVGVAPVFTGLGERGKPAERVADEAVDALLEHLHAGVECIDLHSADQIVLPLALADGPSFYRVARITPHLLTNIDTIRRFLPRRIICTGEAGKPGEVVIE